MLGVTVLAIFYVASCGIWWSVRSKSSWRALLGTLGVTYVGGLVLYCVVSGIAWFIAIIIMLLLLLLEQLIEQRFGYRLGWIGNPTTLLNSWFFGIWIG